MSGRDAFGPQSRNGPPESFGLMFHESKAVFRTMLELMDHHGIPSYAVHDSLIARQRDVETVTTALKANYAAQVGIEPALDIEPKVLESPSPVSQQAA